MDSKTYLSRDGDYDVFVNKMLFVGDIMQLFQFDPFCSFWNTSWY